MSFLSSFKKALGFPDEYDEELDDLVEPETADEAPAADASATASTDTAAEQKPAVKDIDGSLPGEIFDAVLEQFNVIQPEFVRTCLSIEAQREFLMQRIDASLRTRLQAETEAARKRGQLEWEKEKRKMSADIDKIKNEYHSLRQQREEFQSAQLSAARQKRALNERIHDLESQVTALQAEKDQLQLENRSMVNKLRVANVRGGISAPDAEAEAERLATANVELTDKLAAMEARMKEVEEASQNIEARIAQATAEATATAKAETEAEASKTAEQAAEKAAADLKAFEDEKHLLLAKVKELEATIEELEKRPTEEEINAEQEEAIAEIEEQIKQFEVIKKKKDDKIAHLKAQLTEADEKIARYESDKAAAEASMTDRLEALGKEAEEAKAEVKRLTALLQASDGADSRSHDKRRRNHADKKSKKEQPNQPQLTDAADTNIISMASDEESSAGKVKISAIDELMDSTDWFIAPDPVPLKKDPEVDEDFGYKEPVRRSSRDDDKQLSLF